MENQKLYIDETEEIISREEIKNHFHNGMTNEERAATEKWYEENT